MKVVSLLKLDATQVSLEFECPRQSQSIEYGESVRDRAYGRAPRTEPKDFYVEYLMGLNIRKRLLM